MKKIIFILFLLLFVIISIYLFLNSSEEENDLDKVRVQAGWLLNGQFAGVCSAIVNGYYEDLGLDVELIPGGPAGASFIIATNAVAQDQSLDIALDGDIIPLLRGITKESANEQLKVKAFAAFWNENPFGFIVREDSGIEKIEDLALKRKEDGSKFRIGVTADSVIQYAIADYTGVSVDDLDIIIVGFDASSFLANQVDALASYWTTQAYEVEKAGIDYKFISAGELPGFSQPSTVAIAKNSTLEKRKDELKRWMEGTIAGINFVKQNPKEAANNVLDKRCGGPNFDKEQELWLIEKSNYLFDENNIGWIYDEQIMNFAEAYYRLEQISRVPEVDEIIDYSILNQIY